MTVFSKLDMEKFLKGELDLCKNIMESKGGCKFNGGSICENCGAIPLVMKMMSGSVDHRPVKEIFDSEKKQHSTLRTDEYMNLLKDLMSLTGASGPIFLRVYYNHHKDRLIQEGRNSKMYIIIEELLESNPIDLSTCIQIFFAKDTLDDWEKDNAPFIVYLQSIKDEIDKANSL